MIFTSNSIARTRVALGVAMSLCILSGCSVLTELHHDKPIPTAPTPQTTHVEVGGLVREPGVLQTDEDSMTIERAILRAGGPVQGASDSDYDLLVAVRHRDYKPAITTYYSLPLVLRGPVGQIRVTEDDVVTLVRQSETIFGLPQTEPLVQLVAQKQVVRIGTKEVGRNVSIEQIRESSGKARATDAVDYLKSQFGQLSGNADVFVVIRQNWGGIGIARGVFPLNEPKRTRTTYETVAQASAPKSNLPQRSAAPSRDSQLAAFGTDAPETGPESEFSSSRVANSIRLEDAETFRVQEGLAAASQIAVSAATTIIDDQPNIAESAVPKKTVTFQSLDNVQLLGGDQVSVAQSGLLSEVVTSMLRPALEHRVQTASRTAHERMASKRSGNSIARRAIEPIERVKRQVIAGLSRVNR